MEIFIRVEISAWFSELKKIDKNYNYMKKVNPCLKIFQPDLKYNSLKKRKFRGLMKDG